MRNPYNTGHQNHYSLQDMQMAYERGFEDGKKVKSLYKRFINGELSKEEQDWLDSNVVSL